MAVDRTDPPLVGDERSMLEAFLEYHRATLLLKCHGLEPEQLRMRSAEPSSLSLLGLVRHMAEVERGWFRRCFSGEEAPPLFYTPDNEDGDFDDVDTADVHEAFTAWDLEIENARTVAAAAADLDVTGIRKGKGVSLRWIYIHMIEEYARHNGHADLLRERIDGVTGE